MKDVALFAMDNLLSQKTFELLASEQRLSALVQPLANQHRREALYFDERPYRKPNALDRLAEQHQVPTFYVGDASYEPFVRALLMGGTRFIWVSFFNQLFKETLLGAFEHKIVNHHPSALPKLRGPAPLYWTFANELPAFSSTLHRIDEGQDSGPILYQTPALAVTAHTRGEALVEYATGHLPQMFDAWSRGVVRVQEGSPSSAPRPTENERTFTAASRASDVIRMVGALGRFYRFSVKTGDQSFQVSDARVAERLPDGVDSLQQGSSLWMRFKGDCLRLRLS